MRRRIYWLLPDLASARRTMDDLLLARIAEQHLHFVAREGAGEREVCRGRGGVVGVARFARNPEQVRVDDGREIDAWRRRCDVWHRPARPVVCGAEGPPSEGGELGSDGDCQDDRYDRRRRGCEAPRAAFRAAPWRDDSVD